MVHEGSDETSRLPPRCPRQAGAHAALGVLLEAAGDSVGGIPVELLGGYALVHQPMLILEGEAVEPVLSQLGRHALALQGSAEGFVVLGGSEGLDDPAPQVPLPGILARLLFLEAAAVTLRVALELFLLLAELLHQVGPLVPLAQPAFP